MHKRLPIPSCMGWIYCTIPTYLFLTSLPLFHFKLLETFLLYGCLWIRKLLSVRKRFFFSNVTKSVRRLCNTSTIFKQGNCQNVRCIYQLLVFFLLWELYKRTQRARVWYTCRGSLFKDRNEKCKPDASYAFDGDVNTVFVAGFSPLRLLEEVQWVQVGKLNLSYIQ